jgi:hypothetical protein
MPKQIWPWPGCRCPKMECMSFFALMLNRQRKRASTLNESVRLTVYATAVRYPGGDEGVREEEYQAAVEVATTVVHWADGVIQGRENRP